MSETTPPTGKRFSHVYMDRGTPASDSMRFRRRLGVYVRDNFHKQGPLIRNFLEAELGVTIPFSASASRTVCNFIETTNLPDVLDTVTLITDFYREFDGSYSERRRGWIAFARRVLHEENLGYRIDEAGGVHYSPDEEFERNRVAAIRRLGDPRYGAVLHEFEKCFPSLNEDPPDTNGAIRAVFLAVETLTKLMADNTVSRLNAAAVDSHLKPIAQTVYAGNQTACTAAGRQLDSLKDWVNAAHNYRHGQGTNEPTPAPLDLAVSMVSSGASYLRWLAELDQAQQSP